jgi:DNA-binding transcriptional ArsR family regulator
MVNQLAPLDQVFQALADPTRRQLVTRLVEGPASVSELAAPLAMSLPAVLQHLHVLESCALVRSEKVGRVRTCHVEPGGLRRAEDWIAGQRLAWETRLDRLGAYLAESTGAESTGAESTGPKPTKAESAGTGRSRPDPHREGKRR